MSILLAILQFFAMTLVCFREVQRKSPVVFLWATLMIMFGIMHPFGILSGSANYSQWAMDEASIFVLLFCAIYLCTRELCVFALGYDAKSHFSWKRFAREGRDGYAGLLSAIFFMAVIYMISSFSLQSGGLLNTSWGGGRELAENSSYINLEQLALVAFFSTAGIGCFLFVQGRKRAAIAVWLLILLLVLVTRNRIQILPLLVSLISLVIFKLDKITLKHVIFAVVAAVAVILVVYGLRAFRYYGTLQNFFDTFQLADFLNQIAIFLKTDNGELGLRQWFYYFIEHDNNFENFGRGDTYWRMALVFLPTRFSFGLKPDDFAQAMGAAVGLAAGGSMHPTLFGDCFANLGWGGVFLGAFWALFASVVDVITLKFTRPPLLLSAYILAAASFVIIARGAVYNGFFPFAWGLVFLEAFAFFSNKRLYGLGTITDPPLMCNHAFESARMTNE